MKYSVLFLALIFTIPILISCSCAEPNDNFDVWDGTMSDSIEIDSDNKIINLYSAKDLAKFGNIINNDNVSGYSGYTVNLLTDIDLNNLEWTPIGMYDVDYSLRGTFDGNDHTIKNLKCSNDQAIVSGLFGSILGTIKDLNVTDVDIHGGYFAGGICAWSSSFGSLIDNCNVTNGTIISTPRIVDGKLDDGDNVGGILGYAVNKDAVTNCSVKNLKISAYRDVGGILGHANIAYGSEYPVIFENNTVENCTIIQDLSDMYSTSYGDGIIDAFGQLVGRCPDGGIFGDGNSYSNVQLIWKICEDPDFLPAHDQLNKIINTANSIGDENTEINIELGVDASLHEEVTISSPSTTFTIKENTSLTSDSRLKSSETVIIKNYGKIVSNGETINNGVIENYKTIEISATGTLLNHNKIIMPKEQHSELIIGGKLTNYEKGVICDNSESTINKSNVINDGMIIGSNASKWGEVSIPVSEKKVDGKSEISVSAVAVILTEGATVDKPLKITFSGTSSITFPENTLIPKDSIISIIDVSEKDDQKFEVLFDGIRPCTTVNIALPCTEPAEYQTIYVAYVDDSGKIEDMGGTYSDGKITFSTNHNSTYQIIYEGTPEPEPIPEPIVPEKNHTNIEFTVAVMAVVLSLVALAFVLTKKR